MLHDVRYADGATAVHSHVAMHENTTALETIKFVSLPVHGKRIGDDGERSLTVMGKCVASL